MKFNLFTLQKMRRLYPYIYIWGLFSFVSKTSFGSSPEEMSRIISRIEHVNAAFSTFSVSFEVEESRDNGVTWKKKSTDEVKLDTKKDSFFHSNIEKDSEPGISVESKYFFQRDVSTYITKQKVVPRQGTETFSEVAALIVKGKQGVGQHIGNVIYYNNVSNNVVLIRNGKIIFQKSDISCEKRNGKDAVIISSSEEKKENFGRIVFSFDKKNGQTLSRSAYVYRRTGGKLTEILLETVLMEDYFFSNGYVFPAKILYKYSNGTCFRYLLNKATTKINEVIDAKEFLPKLPTGCHVTDRINNTTYITPSIGNSGAEEEIEKGLKKLFDESNK
jgi:hypothetical protein